jgi:hypothetical protein
MFGYDDFEEEEDFSDLDGLRERSSDPFDDLRITDEQLRRLYALLTKNGMDCDLQIRPFGARIVWVWAEADKTRRTRYFEYAINIPRRRPMDFTTMGRSSNPGYGHMAKREAARAKVTDAVLRAMGAVLRISLADYVPDPEMSRYFYENRQR